MARIVQETHTYRDRDDIEVDRDSTADHSAWTAARIVWLIAGVLEGLLAIRFLLSLLGANRLNAFADFIYSVTQPLVAPFFGLFNYQPQYGVGRFEYETLVAMLVYGLIAWVIARLLTVGTRTTEDV